MALYVPRQKPLIAIPLRSDLLGAAGVDFLTMQAPVGLTQTLHDQIVALLETATVQSGDEISRLYSVVDVPGTRVELTPETKSVIVDALKKPFEPKPADPVQPDAASDALSSAAQALSAALARGRTNGHTAPPAKKINGADKDWAAKQREGKDYTSKMKVQAGRYFYLLRSLGRPAMTSELYPLITEPVDQNKSSISACLCVLRDAGYVTSEQIPGISPGNQNVWAVTDLGCEVFDQQKPPLACFLNYGMSIPPDKVQPPLDGNALKEAWQDRHRP